MEKAIVYKRTTFVDELLDTNGVVKNIILIFIGATITALAAKIEIPMQPVPYTLQTFAVMLCGLVLGAKRGALSQVTYIAAGGAGLPVFAGGASGAHILVGKTAGYLYGFILAAWILGYLAEKGWDREVWKISIAVILANVVLLVPGMFWLSSFIGLPAAYQYGVIPFLMSAVMKGAAAIILMPSAWRLINRFSLIVLLSVKIGALISDYQLVRKF